jgi:hypothetical protein
MELVPVLPSLVAVIVIGPPVPAAVTRPLELTVATELLDDDQVIRRPVRILFAASLVTAVNCCVPPRASVAEVGLTVTVLTGGGGAGLTVIVGVVALTDSLVAVIVAMPTPTAVTRPEADTVRTAVLLEAHVTSRPVSTLLLASRVTAVSCCVAPATIGVVAVESVTDATGTGFTVIELVPV